MEMKSLYHIYQKMKELPGGGGGIGAIVGREGSDMIVGIGGGMCVDRNGSLGPVDMDKSKVDEGLSNGSFGMKKEGETAGGSIGDAGRFSTVELFLGASTVFVSALGLSTASSSATVLIVSGLRDRFSTARAKLSGF